jgi:hypothetical protein
MSVWQTPQAIVLTRTSSPSGIGVSNSTSFIGPAFSKN